MKFNVTNAATLSASLGFGDAGNKTHDAWCSVYFSGTLGAGATIELQLSPDASITSDPVNGVTDANSRWFTPTNLTLTSITATNGVVHFAGRYRKARAAIVNTQASDNVIVEVV